MILKIEISRAHKAQTTQRLRDILSEIERAPHKTIDAKKGEWEFIQEGQES